jgi:hypothetical protein
MPSESLPVNWSAFNHHQVLPWKMSRAGAAATLQRARNLRDGYGPQDAEAVPAQTLPSLDNGQTPAPAGSSEGTAACDQLVQDHDDGNHQQQM